MSKQNSPISIVHFCISVHLSVTWTYVQTTGMSFRVSSCVVGLVKLPMTAEWRVTALSITVASLLFEKEKAT
ncbi:unnamed protein product [Hymenolepis diminuta]|uniref:Secreted protein n=1 Tax=Hymenolepis diminuta TaxID=6216 RepID=A0A0R3SW20_HYMDI|nr:unnamed protein product [Hymenolepis diminuta]